LTIPENLAASATATAFRSDTDHGFTPDLMVDDDPGTRWSSGPTRDPGWVAVDLGKPGLISGVQINFETAYARKVSIEVSDDGIHWRPATTGEGHVGLVTLSFDPIRARNVRVQLSDPDTGWGYSIWDLQVLGTDAPPPKAARSIYLDYIAPPGDVFYNEITVQQSQPGSYFEVCGFDGGYFGIQELANGHKVAIFSVWDTGATVDGVKVNHEAKVLYHSDDVAARRFGGEGTGAHTDFNFDWKIGKTYRLALRAAPTIDGTAFSAYIYLDATGQWKLLATLARVSSDNRGLLSGYYSFIEDFRRNTISATETRRAVFGNGWIHSGDRWIKLNKARFEAPPPGTEAVDTIDAGVTEGNFFLQTGGDTHQSMALHSLLTRPNDDSVAPTIPQQTGK
jgi:hypothetical protein